MVHVNLYKQSCETTNKSMINAKPFESFLMKMDYVQFLLVMNLATCTLTKGKNANDTIRHNSKIPAP